jgi:DNA-binding NarL/FixJ family response regulator
MLNRTLLRATPNRRPVAPAARLAKEATSAGARLRVYLVEDSRHVLQALTEQIEETGAVVAGHSDSAREALGEIFRIDPHVVVLDVALREGTGFDVLAGLAQVRPPSLHYSLVLTNYALGDYREAARRYQADAFFDKGSGIPNMLRLIRHLNRQLVDGKPLTPY